MDKDYKNNFLKRSFTASFLAIGIVTLFILDISAIIGILLIFLAIIAMREVAEINKSSCRGVKTSYIWLIVLSLFLFYFVNTKIVFGIYIHLSSLFWLIFSIFLLSKNLKILKFISFQNPLLIQFLLTSFIISILFILMLPQIFEFKNSIFILLLITVSALTDTFAYIGGSLIGKTPLLKEISPNKTLEGFFSGIIAALILGIVFVYVFDDMNFIYIFVIGSFFAIVGDYFFSYLKRKSNIKDTGSILPGHGGILDRIDSHIAAITIMIFLTFLLY